MNVGYAFDHSSDSFVLQAFKIEGPQSTKDPVIRNALNVSMLIGLPPYEVCLSIPSLQGLQTFLQPKKDPSSYVNFSNLRNFGYLLDYGVVVLDANPDQTAHSLLYFGDGYYDTEEDSYKAQIGPNFETEGDLYGVYLRTTAKWEQSKKGSNFIDRFIALKDAHEKGRQPRVSKARPVLALSESQKLLQEIRAGLAS
jgi:hypothetical protein